VCAPVGQRHVVHTTLEDDDVVLAHERFELRRFVEAIGFLRVGVQHVEEAVAKRVVYEDGGHDTCTLLVVNEARVTWRELEVVTDLRPSEVPPPACLSPTAEALEALLYTVGHAPSNVEDASALEAICSLRLLVKV
jgi:hypothetical protein|tara:strand:+ start:108 stop:515 length:408 start_codon:yes stop_codon:yes gene_type:complete